MNRKTNQWLAATYYLWQIFFVLAPLLLLLYQSFFNPAGELTLANYRDYFTSVNYMKMTLSSFVYALLITLITFLVAYPTAYFLNQTRRKQLWLMLIILPTWVNLLLKTYAFIGLLSQTGPVVAWMKALGLGSIQLLFTNAAFILVATYIELPFMIVPIFNAMEQIPQSYIEASHDLGASKWTTLMRVIFPLTLRGIRSGVQTVFIPSLSLFMIARLIGGNRVITLGTAVEQHFLTTQNWGMGSTIGVVLMVMMVVTMVLTRDKEGEGAFSHD